MQRRIAELEQLVKDTGSTLNSVYNWRPYVMHCRLLDYFPIVQDICRQVILGGYGSRCTYDKLERGVYVPRNAFYYHICCCCCRCDVYCGCDSMFMKTIQITHKTEINCGKRRKDIYIYIAECTLELFNEDLNKMAIQLNNAIFIHWMLCPGLGDVTRHVSSYIQQLILEDI